MKNTKYISVSLGILVLMLAPAFFGIAIAEDVYQYVNTQGNVAVEIADNPEEAIAGAENRDPQSGVILTGVDVASALETTGENEYLYVNAQGDMAVEIADNPEEAIAGAENRDPQSGVILVTQSQ